MDPKPHRSLPKWAIALVVVVVATSGLAAVVLVRSWSGSTTSSGYCPSTPCSPEITGWLHTNSGNTGIYAANGTVVPLRGVNDDGLDFGTGNPSTSPDSCGKGWSLPSTSFSDIAKWGFNFVRVPISWENLEPATPTLEPNGTWAHHWNGAYLSGFIRQSGG